MRTITEKQFWFLTSAETLIVGSFIAFLDAVLPQKMPVFLSAFDPPFLGLWMIAFGTYSAVVSIRQVTFTAIISNLVFWSFISTSSFFEMISTRGTVIVVPGTLFIVSTFLVVRILFNAWIIDLYHGRGKG